MLDFIMNTINRRQFLSGALSTTVTAATLSHLAYGTPATSSLFDCGVASGDPTATQVILWTHAQGVTQVTWQIATDSTFTHILQQGISQTSPAQDHTVKVDVKDLTPGQEYFYRFSANGQYSEIGRTATLPVADIDKLTLAIASCSNYPFGYFNAYQDIANSKDIDFVIHLGDYIYEYGQDGWGASSGEVLGRQHLPANEIVSLADYRQRHKQYKMDPASRAMHRAHPIIPTWDDHESANNPYSDGAQNHQPNEGAWSTRRDASIQAYYEWMPIREPQPGYTRAQLWRHFEFGKLATLTTLETRHTGRDKQVDYADHLDNIKDTSTREHFMRDILGDPSRQMLGEKMQQFVATSLKSSVDNASQWRLLGNQIPMARTHAPSPKSGIKYPALADDHPYANDVANFVKKVNWNLPLYLDTWDGYEGAREAFYTLCANMGVRDLVVITGDSHSFWANELYTQNGLPMGVEIGTAGITSPGDFESFGKPIAGQIDNGLSARNKEVRWTDCQHRGYVKMHITAAQIDTYYVAVDTINQPRFTAFNLRHETLVKTADTVQYRELKS
jgi:phosphodiesterase/alkaline phosphatase D-like protein